jgi:hypothetical protein
LQVELDAVDLQALQRKPWVVYAKRPFGGPEQVFRYLGRYTHRVGISNQRLVSMDERGVTFRTKDGRRVTVAPHEMLARFVQHVLPRGFVKIRHYGLHSASHATSRLEIARHALDPNSMHSARTESHEVASVEDLFFHLTGVDLRLCPACSAPALVRTALPDPRVRAPPRDA